MIVKICGITNIDDARYALDAGADWIGLNLVAGRRRIELATAERILAQLEEPSLAVVLVRLDRGQIPRATFEVLLAHRLRRVQLYGEPLAEAVHSLVLEGFEPIVSVPVADEQSLNSFDALLSSCGDTPPAYVLFDTSAKGQLGGTGRRANWEAIASACNKGCYLGWPPVLMAGGLTPTNVEEAVRRLSPVGVDVSSGVESEPGCKDHAKIKAFIAAVRKITPNNI